MNSLELVRENICKNCKAFNPPPPGKQTGECRRRAPTPIPTITQGLTGPTVNVVSAFAPMPENEWCYEHDALGYYHE